MMAAGFILLGVLPHHASSQEVQTGELEVPGGVVHYEVAGSGPAIVLVHGGMMDGRMWNPQFVAFAERGRVIRFDVRGLGESPTSTAPFKPADDMLAILDHLEIDRAAVVGLSMGGGFAIDFALTYPERVRALVLAEPFVPGYTMSADVMQRMMVVGQALQRNDRTAAIEAFLESPTFSQVRQKPDVRKAIEGLVEDNLDGLFAMQYVRFHEPNAVVRLGDLTMPTLLLVSDHPGPDATKINQRLAADIGVARSVMIVDSGHIMNLEQPEQFNRVVLEFVARHQ